MDLQGLVEATNNKKTETEEKSVNGNEIYASLVFIQNSIQALKMQQSEQSKIYTDTNQKLTLKINNGFTDLQKSISAVPVQTQTLTVNEVKEIIKGVQTVEKICRVLNCRIDEIIEFIPDFANNGGNNNA